MGATRFVLTILLLAFAREAHAQGVDLVVFGPISDGSDAKLTSEVTSAMAKVKVGVSAPKKLDVACTASTECLVNAGAEASGRRALAIVVAGGKIGFVVVDVADKELISKRDVVIEKRKVSRELGKELKKFLDEAPTERAKTLFNDGNRHYELGEFAQALDIYKKAYRVQPLPAFQFNIAQCYRKLNQHKDAIAMYQAYLVGVPNAENKQLVESLITESKNQIAAAEKSARDAEQAKLDAEKKKAEDARKQQEAEAVAKKAVADAEAEKRKQLQVKLDAEHQKEMDKTYNHHPARTPMIITGLAGVATAGVGGFFGWRAKKHQSAFDDAGCGDPTQDHLPQSTLDGCRDDKDAGRRDARLSNILIGAGGAVVIGSLIVYILDPGNIEAPKRERPTVSISSSSVQVVFQW